MTAWLLKLAGTFVALCAAASMFYIAGALFGPVGVSAVGAILACAAFAAVVAGPPPTKPS